MEKRLFLIHNWFQPSHKLIHLALIREGPTFLSCQVSKISESRYGTPYFLYSVKLPVYLQNRYTDYANNLLCHGLGKKRDGFKLNELSRNS